VENKIYTGIKFFGLKVWLDSTGELEMDEAAKSVFRDDYRKTAPLEISRPDVKLILEWSRWPAPDVA
jgi:hypothetical protein